MAVHLIYGVPGSGKSYECVEFKILPALEKGRRIVTNIEGLNYQAISKYLKKDLAEIEQNLISVTKEQIESADFWYDPDKTAETIVKAGDLVLIDEAWEFYKKGQKLSDEFIKWISKHRHYVDLNTNLSSDLVLANQDNKLDSFITGRIEFRFQCRKMKMVGLNDTYQVFVYSGEVRTYQKKIQRKYNPKVFDLYKSTQVENAEESSDSRVNIFTRGIKLAIIVVAIAILGGLAYTFYFVSNPSELAGLNNLEQPTQTTNSNTNLTSVQKVESPLVSSNEERLVALYRINNQVYALTQTKDGRYKTQSNLQIVTTSDVDVYVNKPIPAELNNYITPYSGQLAPQSTGGVTK